MTEVAAFAVADATGRILRVGVCPAGDLGLQAAPGETVVQVQDIPSAGLYWVNGGLLEARPTVPGLPATLTIAAGTDWTVAGVPAASGIHVDEVLVGTADGSDLVLSFPEPGLWRLRVAPPWPWRAADCEVTAT